MKLTPAIKGQLTKAIKNYAGSVPTGGFRTDWGNTEYRKRLVSVIRSVFLKIMPREQAKHATRKYLATLAR